MFCSKRMHRRLLLMTTIALFAVLAPGAVKTGETSETETVGLAARGLNLVGDAQWVDDWLRINLADMDRCGAAWNDEKVAVQGGFSTRFRFLISEPGGMQHPTEGTDGADGFAFVIQNHAADAIGLAYSNMGYGWMPNCIAVEFDTWLNGGGGGGDFGEPDGHHVSVNTAGPYPNQTHHLYSLGCVSTPTIVDYLEHEVIIQYEPGTLRIYLDDPSNPILVLPIDIGAVLDLDEGRAWLGFTGATGMAWEYHDILDWTIDDSPVAMTVTTFGGLKSMFR